MSHRGPHSRSRLTEPEALPPLPQRRPDCDPGNRWIGPRVPGELTTKIVPTDEGPRLMVTMRCPGATMTVMLTRADAEAWAEQIASQAQGISEAGLFAGQGG